MPSIRATSTVIPSRQSRFTKVVVVKHGTQAGLPTVDILMKDEAGNQYVVMLTAALLRSLPLDP